MTVKEIAVAVGKAERTVQTWAKDTGAKIASIGAKIASAQKTGIAVDYTLTEVIEIIREGMGDGPAGVFADNATKKPQRKQQSISAEMLKQARLSIKDNLLSRDEARMLLGVEAMTKPIPVVEPLGRISPQAYAVEMKVREKAKQMLIEQKMQEDLFKGELE